LARQNDATTFAQLPKLKQQAVLRGVAAESQADQVRKSKGEAIPQPSLEQQNAFRAKYGLEPVTPNQQGFRESLQFPGQFGANPDQVVGRVKGQSRALANRAVSGVLNPLPQADRDTATKAAIRQQILEERAQTERSMATRPQRGATYSQARLPDLTEEDLQAETERRFGEQPTEAERAQAGQRIAGLEGQNYFQRQWNQPYIESSVHKAQSALGRAAANAPIGSGALTEYLKQGFTSAADQARSQSKIDDLVANHDYEGDHGVMRQIGREGVKQAFSLVPMIVSSEATGIPFPYLMAGQSYIENESKPLNERLFAAGTAYLLGKAYETLPNVGVKGLQAVPGRIGKLATKYPGIASRVVGAAGFGGYGAGETTLRGGTAEQALVSGISQAIPGAALAGEPEGPEATRAPLVEGERTGLITPFSRKAQQVNAIADSLAEPQARRPIEVRKGTPNETARTNGNGGLSPADPRQLVRPEDIQVSQPGTQPQRPGERVRAETSRLQATGLSENQVTPKRNPFADREVPRETPQVSEVSNKEVSPMGDKDEGPGTKHPETGRKFSSTQVNLPPEIAVKQKAAAMAIPDSELAADGREDKAHVTVKYGLHTENAKEVADVLKGEPPIKATIGKVSIFPAKEGADYDVVKMDVDSPDLHRLNAKIAKNLDVTDTHPEYKPHITLAYVKPGEGAKYDGKANELTGQEVTLNNVEFSGRGGQSEGIPLTGDRLPSERESVTQVSTNGLQSDPVHHSDLQPRDAGQFTGGPPAEGMTRLYRADRADATEAQGARWSPDLNYVSDKYGKGVQNGESIWYTDVPTKLFDDEYSHVPSVTNTNIIETLGGKVEPKLFRRVNQESAKAGQSQTIDDILTKEQSNATQTGEDKGNTPEELQGTGSGEDLSAHNAEVREGQGRSPEGSDSAERVRAEQEPVQESKAPTIDSQLKKQMVPDRTITRQGSKFLPPDGTEFTGKVPDAGLKSTRSRSLTKAL
jgi:2'-5' RNA ligase